MTAVNGARARIDTNRWLKPIVVVLAFAAGYFGVLPFLVPEWGAQVSGLVGKDIFFYRLAGAASFGYAIGLVAAWRDGWRGLRLPIIGMAVFAVGSNIACVAAIAAGEGTWLPYLVLVASSIFLALHVLLIQNPPARGEPVGSGAPDVDDWVVYLLAFGSIAGAATGALALILGGEGGRLLAGYSGTDSFVYRQAGAATLGSAMGGFLSIRSRRWHEIRGGLVGAFAFNALSLMAALIEIAGGGVNLLSIAILGVSLIVTVGLAFALRRGGR